MTLAPYFHVGILVPNLDEAMEKFSEVFKVTWTERGTAHADFWERDRGGSHPLTLDVAYTREGPPHIELLEATGDGLYGHQHVGGLHHIGGWEPDCTGRQRELEEAGYPAVGTQYNPNKEIIVSYFDPKALYGIMFEILDEGRKPALEEWFKGGPFRD
jgi:hypothetical protein